MTAEQVLDAMIQGLDDILGHDAGVHFEESTPTNDKHASKHGQMLSAFYAFCKKFSGRCTTHYAVDSEHGLGPFRRMRHFTGIQPYTVA